MNTRSIPLAAIFPLFSVPLVCAQVSEATFRSISTPESVDTRIGTLDFTGDTPSDETVAAVE